MTTLYQLVASGYRKYIDGSHHIYSRRVFYTLEQIREFEPEFRRLVTTDKNEHDLQVLVDDDNLRVDYVELEL